MTLLLIEGFPIGWTGNLSMPDGSRYYAGKWTSASLRAAAANARHGQWGGLFANSNTIGADIMLAQRLSASQKDDYLVVGFASLATGQARLLTLGGDLGATSHLTLGWSDGSTIVVRRGDVTGPIIASGTVSTPATTGSGGTSGWHYIELVARLADSGGLVEIWVDNVQVASFSGDTKNGGTDPNFDTVSFWSCNGIDDIYMLNEQGGYNNSRLGDCRVDQFPFADGSTTQWVGHDGSTSGNAYYLGNYNYGFSWTTSLHADSDNQLDTFNVANESLGAQESIRGVQVWAYGAKGDSGARTLAFTSTTGAGTAQSPDLPLYTTGAAAAAMFERDPAGNPWTNANYNAAEFGIKARP